jgi:hypothetical protein
VAILISMSSIRLHWMFDSAADGRSWPRRLTSVEIDQSSEARNRRAWCSLLEDLGLRYAFVTPHDLRRGRLLSGSFRVLILPRVVALSSEETEVIKEFVSQGHLLVADGWTGLFNSRLRESPHPALDALFGIDRIRREVPLASGRPSNPSLPYPVAETGLVTGPSGRAARSLDGTPILITSKKSQLGKGSPTLYLNLEVAGYAEDRLLRPEKARWLLDRIRPHFFDAEVRPKLLLRMLPESPTWPLESFIRNCGRDVILAFQINLRPSAPSIPWEVILKRPIVRVEATLWRSFQVQDLRSGVQLGSRNSIEVEVAPDRPTFFRLSN